MSPTNSHTWEHPLAIVYQSPTRLNFFTLVDKNRDLLRRFLLL